MKLPVDTISRNVRASSMSIRHPAESLRSSGNYIRLPDVLANRTLRFGSIWISCSKEEAVGCGSPKRRRFVRPIRRMLRWRYRGEHPVRTNPMRVASILSVARERLVTIQVDALLTEAAKLLCGTHRALLVVCDNKGTMTGVITKTDIVRQVDRCHGVLSDVRIADVMTAAVTYCKLGDSSARCSGAHASARLCPYTYDR